ncbi:hypothetical protein Trydic_g2735 [Trypoxylus dichotomus]
MLDYVAARATHTHAVYITAPNIGGPDSPYDKECSISFGECGLTSTACCKEREGGPNDLRSGPEKTEKAGEDGEYFPLPQNEVRLSRLTYEEHYPFSRQQPQIDFRGDAKKPQACFSISFVFRPRALPRKKIAEHGKPLLEMEKKEEPEKVYISGSGIETTTVDKISAHSIVEKTRNKRTTPSRISIKNRHRFREQKASSFRRRTWQRDMKFLN